MRNIDRLAGKLLCFLLLVLMLGGCGNAAGDKVDKAGTAQSTEETGKRTEENEKLNIVCTIFPQYDFVRQIGGENVELRMLLKPGEEVHSYEPTPKDIRDIRNCDLFIYVGGENDVWVERILESMGEEAPRTIRLVDLVDTVEEEIVEGMQAEKGSDHDHESEAEQEDHDGHDHESEAEQVDHDDHKEEIDEHVWTSPVNAMTITSRIAEAMEQMDPLKADIFAQNTEKYLGELRVLDQAFRDVVEKANRKEIVFGDRFPFRYFADEYGLTYSAAFAGCSSESEPSAATLAYLIRKVRNEQTPVVFSIEFSSGNIARSICESSNAQQRTFYSCHNVTRDQFEGGENYLSMMWQNVESLKEALR